MFGGVWVAIRSSRYRSSEAKPSSNPNMSKRFAIIFVFITTLVMIIIGGTLFK